MKEFFQKDNLHIVDIARIISQNITFEMLNYSFSYELNGLLALP